MLAKHRLRDRAKGQFGHSSSSSSMPLTSRIYASDEELGKRDDDHKPSTLSQSWKSPLRWRRRRILLGLAATFFVWLFIHNIPTDLGSIDERMGRPLRPGRSVGGVEFGYKPPAYKADDQSTSQPASSIRAPVGPPPRNRDETSIEDDHYYSGHIKFYELASSLRTISRTQGHKPDNRNVLFAAASLRSAANLIPMACEMRRWERNHVHIVLLGRDSIPLDELLTINGVSKESCDIHFHDGRSDYSDYSSDLRAEAAVSGAMNHVNTYMHPQVIITDDSATEDVFFTKGMRSKAKELNRPIIEIPQGKYEDFLWMTRLDSSSLASWHKPTINILVHAPSHSSGSLVRVLESLKSADFTGLVPPQLTLDLPADIESFVRHYIRDMVWPPASDKLVPHHNSVVLHHRISSAKATTESNAMRVLESFYPANPDHSHVLLLSSQIELSPLFYHYLFFHVLEYHYSAYASESSKQLLGLSLSAPQSYLNGSAPFVAPSITDMSGRKYANRAQEEEGDRSAPFLWQAPDADAALIFGAKWAEFHDYLKNRLRAMHDPTAVTTAPIRPRKLVSETQPGWMDYLLELMRARGWHLLFPAAREAGGWVTIHQDLYQTPEEFVRTPNLDDDDSEAQELPDVDEPFLTVDTGVPASQFKEQRNTVQHSQPLHAMLPFEGDMPELLSLPAMSYTGDIVPAHILETEALVYKEKLRQDVGGCDMAQAGINRPIVNGETDDLFCFIDQEIAADPNENTAEVIAHESGPSSTENVNKNSGEQDGVKPIGHKEAPTGTQEVDDAENTAKAAIEERRRKQNTYSPASINEEIAEPVVRNMVPAATEEADDPENTALAAIRERQRLQDQGSTSADEAEVAAPKRVLDSTAKQKLAHQTLSDVSRNELAAAQKIAPMPAVVEDLGPARRK